MILGDLGNHVTCQQEIDTTPESIRLRAHRDESLKDHREVDTG
jgi:hypothetical protein